MAEIALAVVHPGTVSFDWHQSVLETLRSEHHVRLISVESGPLISRARNKVLDLFLDSDADYLLFTDADVVWEPGVVDQLLASDKPIISALCYGHSFSQGAMPVVSVKRDGHFVRLTHQDVEWLKEEFPVDRAVPVDGVGMPFTLIKREVVEALRPIKTLWPYAEITYGKDSLGEDVTFCVRARKKGFQSFLHLDARVGHRKTVTL